VGATARSFTFAEAGLLAATDGGGVFLANASHTAWNESNDGLDDLDVLSITSAVNSMGTELVVLGTRGSGVFASFDGGETWVPKNAGLFPPDTVRAVTAIVDDYFGNGILLLDGSDRGIYRSNDGGYGIWWWPVVTGLTTRRVNSLLPVMDGGDPDDGSGSRNVYAGTQGGGVFVSLDGILWIPKVDGLTNLTIAALAASSTYATVFAGTAGGGVFRSRSTYEAWTAINDGLPDWDVQALATHGTTIFAGTSSGVFVAPDDGDGPWTPENTGLPNTDVVALATDGVHLFASTPSGVFRRPVSELAPP
jgi:hypothetical protein